MKPEELGLTVEIEDITPEKAVEYLDNNFKHREIKQTRVDKYVASMTEGNWKFNGKVITFNKDGVLLNGQHRLTAVVQSGVPLRTLVVRGIENP